MRNNTINKKILILWKISEIESKLMVHDVAFCVLRYRHYVVDIEPD